MSILAVDIGGTWIKVLVSGRVAQPRRIPSGSSLTPQRMVDDVRAAVGEWDYDVVSIGYPGPVMNGRIVIEPWNLGKGWVGFNFTEAFGRPARLINDAAMQALGSYRGGKMLYSQTLALPAPEGT
jgi:polyphosphate glucokinase